MARIAFQLGAALSANRGQIVEHDGQFVVNQWAQLLHHHLVEDFTDSSRPRLAITR